MVSEARKQVAVGEKMLLPTEHTEKRHRERSEEKVGIFSVLNIGHEGSVKEAKALLSRIFLCYTHFLLLL